MCTGIRVVRNRNQGLQNIAVEWFDTGDRTVWTRGHARV